MKQAIKPGQNYALNRLISQFAATHDERLHVIGRLVGREVTSSKELTRAEWRRIRDRAYPRWTDGDWEPCREFRALVVALVEEYRETVLGQLRLF